MSEISLDVEASEGPAEMTRNELMPNILMHIKAGTKYESFRLMLSHLLRIHFDDPKLGKKELDQDIGAINMEIRHLKMAQRIRITPNYVVRYIEYVEIFKNLCVVQELG